MYQQTLPLPVITAVRSSPFQTICIISRVPIAVLSMIHGIAPSVVPSTMSLWHGIAGSAGIVGQSTNYGIAVPVVLRTSSPALGTSLTAGSVEHITPSSV